MNTPRVLMLDFDTSQYLNRDLKLILETARNPCVELCQDHINQTSLAGAITRYDPAVVFLLLGQIPLKRAGGFLADMGCNSGLNNPRCPMLVVAGDSEPDDLYQLLERGVADFVTSPLRASDILPRLWRLLNDTSHNISQHFGNNQVGQNSVSQQSGTGALRALVGRSPEFMTQLQRIPMVAKCDASVLISGETGTGKELFAKAIHQLSPRAKGPFTPVNCGAIPVELVENELFGHERGAFTGANASRTGLIQEANGGTLFLDEIDSLPLLAQVKLLRFLQEKEYRALGSSKTHRADVRVITATNLNIEEAVRCGRLRQDLYYRLNIIALMLPPLRQRPDDISELADHFLRKFAVKFGKRLTGFSAEARQQLSLHSWPGNVRELENTIERAVALCEQDTITEADIALPSSTKEAGPQSFQDAKASVVTQFERNYLQSLMLACSGNITRAAEVAQKDRRAFWELLRKHKIDARNYKNERAGLMQPTPRNDPGALILAS